jgi:hypothetical protein
VKKLIVTVAVVVNLVVPGVASADDTYGGSNGWGLGGAYYEYFWEPLENWWSGETSFWGGDSGGDSGNSGEGNGGSNSEGGW